MPLPRPSTFDLQRQCGRTRIYVINRNHPRRWPPRRYLACAATTNASHCDQGHRSCSGSASSYTYAHHMLLPHLEQCTLGVNYSSGQTGFAGAVVVTVRRHSARRADDVLLPLPSRTVFRIVDAAPRGGTNLVPSERNFCHHALSCGGLIPLIDNLRCNGRPTWSPGPGFRIPSVPPTPIISSAIIFPGRTRRVPRGFTAF